MRLTILTQYFPPEIGAPQTRLSELAAHFIEHGHSVTVLTAMPNYPSGKIHAGYGGVLKQETHGKLRVIRTFIYPTGQAKFLRRMANYLSFTASSAILGSFLLKRSDFLLVESPPLFLGMSAIVLSWLKRAKLIFNVSDLWPESAVRLGMLQPDGLAFRLSSCLEALCYRSAWLVTGQSKTILADIKARFPSCPTFHLSNGVDTRLFGQEKRTDEARASLNGEGKLVALYGGLHGLAQGLSQVLDAAEALNGRSELQFVLLGDGPEKQSLVDSAKQRGLGNVAFLKSRAARELPPLVASADIILVPLRMYIPGAVPSKIYEAMASGRPIVLIAEGEAAEIIHGHNAGIVVKPGDIPSLTAAIQLLCGDSAMRQTLGENGRRAAENYFDRTKIANRFIEHLENGLRFPAG